MKQLILSTSMGFCALSLAACQTADLTHFNRVVETISPARDLKSEQTVTFVDAKQRAVVSSRINGDVAICAEPSPDALSALAASQGLSISRGDIEVALSSALSESAGNIGLRTQSIQLMRDMMYRLCEASISNSLEPLAFETTYRRFQSSMVAILAIEQLTGTVAGPTVGLGGGATASALGAAGVLDEMVEEQERQVEGAKTKVQEIETKLTAARAKQTAHEQALQTQVGEGKPIPQDDAELVSIKSEITELEAEKASAEATQKHEERMLEQLREAEVLSASSRATTNSFGRATEAVFSGAYFDGRDAQAQIAVANTIGGIVEQAINLPFTGELCTTVLIATAQESFNNIDDSRVRPSSAIFQNEFLRAETAYEEKRRALISEESKLDILMQRAESADFAIFRLEDRIAELESQLSVNASDEDLATQISVSTLDLIRAQKLRTQLSDQVLAQEEIVRLARFDSSQAENRANRFYEETGEVGATKVVSRCLEFLETERARRRNLLDRYTDLSATRNLLIAAVARDVELLKDEHATANLVTILEATDTALREISINATTDQIPRANGAQYPFSSEVQTRRQKTCHQDTEAESDDTCSQEEGLAGEDTSAENESS